ncbi:methyltransferase domain-containing protein [bacterium]|nr:methyltransferase domain-containing protein [candidate division CSSED10-310 bacterium]
MTGHTPTGAGGSSFEEVDLGTVFAALDLRPGAVLLDLACGRGFYSLHAARHTPVSHIYAVDLWSEGLNGLRENIAREGLHTIEPVPADAGKGLPLPAGAVDRCLVATVLHDFVDDGVHARVLEELARVMKPDAKLVIIEFHKVDSDKGPPRRVRLSPEEVGDLVAPAGFQCGGSVTVSPRHYMCECAMHVKVVADQ